MKEYEAKPGNRKIPSAHVRFSDDEYQKLEEVQKLTGLSIPVLLKKAFFQRKNPQVLLPEAERKAWFQELRRIGNNINQIARRVNSGLFDGWYPDIQELAKKLAAMELMVTSFYGHR